MPVRRINIRQATFPKTNVHAMQVRMGFNTQPAISKMKVTYQSGVNKCVRTVFGEIFPIEDAINNGKFVRVTDATGTALHPIEAIVELPKYSTKNLTGLAASLFKSRYKKGQMPTKAGLDALVAEAMRGDSVPHVRKRTININPLKDAFNGINV